MRRILAEYDDDDSAHVTVVDGTKALSGTSLTGHAQWMVDIDIPKSVKGIYSQTFIYCFRLKTIALPEGVETLWSSAFYRCPVLESVFLPDSLTNIMPGVFNGCPKLTRIELGPNNKKYYCENNCIIERATKKLITGCNGSVIPDDVTTIEDGAFSDCEDLAEINIPDSVMSIGDHAFENCIRIKTVSIPEGITTIGYCTFKRCMGLTSVSIPSSVRLIRGNAFVDCNNLAEINYSGTMAQWAAIEKESAIKNFRWDAAGGDYTKIKWNENTGKYRVNCTDGVLTKKQS